MRQVDVFLRDDLSSGVLNCHVDLIDLSGRNIKIVTRQKLLAIKESIVPLRNKDPMDIAALRGMIHDE